jgi:hypothetical protein
MREGKKIQFWEKILFEDMSLIHEVYVEDEEK